MVDGGFYEEQLRSIVGGRRWLLALDVAVALEARDWLGGAGA